MIKYSLIFLNKLKEEVKKVDFKAFVEEARDMNTKITGEEIPYEVAFVFSACKKQRTPQKKRLSAFWQS